LAKPPKNYFKTTFFVYKILFLKGKNKFKRGKQKNLFAVNVGAEYAFIINW
jgi:hypothetical protein